MDAAPSVLGRAGKNPRRVHRVQKGGPIHEAEITQVRAGEAMTVRKNADTSADASQKARSRKDSSGSDEHPADDLSKERQL